MEWNQEVFLKNVTARVAEKFGKQAGLNKIVGRDALTRWKDGQRPSLAILLKTAHALDCTIDDLLVDEDLLSLPTPDPSSSAHDPLLLALQTSLAKSDKIIEGLSKHVAELEKKMVVCDECKNEISIFMNDLNELKSDFKKRIKKVI